jgi:hypothetical protein
VTCDHPLRRLRPGLRSALAAVAAFGILTACAPPPDLGTAGGIPVPDGPVTLVPLDPILAEAASDQAKPAPSLAERARRLRARATALRAASAP